MAMAPEVGDDDYKAEVADDDYKVATAPDDPPPSHSRVLQCSGPLAAPEPRTQPAVDPEGPLDYGYQLTVPLAAIHTVPDHRHSHQGVDSLPFKLLSGRPTRATPSSNDPLISLSALKYFSPPPYHTRQTRRGAPTMPPGLMRSSTSPNNPRTLTAQSTPPTTESPNSLLAVASLPPVAAPPPEKPQTCTPHPTPLHEIALLQAIASLPLVHGPTTCPVTTPRPPNPSSHTHPFLPPATSHNPNPRPPSTPYFVQPAGAPPTHLPQPTQHPHTPHLAPAAPAAPAAAAAAPASASPGESHPEPSFGSRRAGSGRSLLSLLHEDDHAEIVSPTPDQLKSHVPHVPSDPKPTPSPKPLHAPHAPAQTVTGPLVPTGGRGGRGLGEGPSGKGEGLTRLRGGGVGVDVDRKVGLEAIGLSEYNLGGVFGQGHFGEVWSAQRHVEGDGWEAGFVLKHIPASKGAAFRLSGLREAYFGRLLVQVQPAAATAPHSSMLRRPPSHRHGQPHGRGPAEGRAAGGGGGAGSKGNVTSPSRVGGGAGGRWDGEGPRDGAASGGYLGGAAGGSCSWDEACGGSGMCCSGYQHLVRFQEAFSSAPDGDLWLAFRHEGVALHSLMYHPIHPSTGPQGQQAGRATGASRGFQIMGPSPWWRRLREVQPAGAGVRRLLQQLLMALDVVHSTNVTHRDVKPENLLLAAGVEESPEAGHLRLIDFGSAVDPWTLQHLYGDEGPSAEELTLEYAPPEVLFGRYWEGMRAVKKVWTYDIWSAGVVWLELLMATPHVFLPPPATRARLDAKLRLASKPEGERHLAYILRGLMELCIYPPRTPSAPPRGRREGGKLLVPWTCTEAAIMDTLKSRDPTGQGLESEAALQLLMRMLHWDPSARPTAAQALQHAYFVNAAGGASKPSACRPFPEPGWC